MRNSIIIRQPFYEEILLEPPSEGANEICIVSGFASPAMAYSHFSRLNLRNFESVKVKLIIGMALRDGIYIAEHRAYNDLATSEYRGRFECRYVVDNPPDHSKVYIWLKDGVPIKSYLGSANYSQNAFLRNSQREIMNIANPVESYSYYKYVKRKSKSCTLANIQNCINFHKIKKLPKPARRPKVPTKVGESPIPDLTTSNLDFVDLPLTTVSGEVGVRSGLNWGQRPGRDHDQAYIPVPAPIRKSGFFPDRGLSFFVETDDGISLNCVTAQQNAKSIESKPSNAILGAYFRNRLGLDPGQYVDKQDLVNYGRSTVTFYKLNDENYFMDFSV